MSDNLVLIEPNSDLQLMAFYDEAIKLEEYAKARVIREFSDLKHANDDLSIIVRVKKGMEERRKEYLNPFQAHVKETNEAYKALMLPIEQADKLTRGKILAFSQEQERKRRKQEEVNRLRMEAAQKEMELTGELSQSVDLVDVIAEAPKRVSTELGTSAQRDNWTWEVVDPLQVPDEYKIINAGMVTSVVKASKGNLTIPGIRIYNKPILQVTTR